VRVVRDAVGREPCLDSPEAGFFFLVSIDLNGLRSRTAMQESVVLPQARGRSLGLRLACLTILLTSLAFSTGCPSKGKGPKNSVSGKVTLDSQPVTGTVVFIYADNKEVSSPTNLQGVYTIADPPTGQVKVLVKPLPGTGPGLKPIPGPELPKVSSAGEGVPPPAKYADVRTTDLIYEVKTGTHTFDIPLKR